MVLLTVVLTMILIRLLGLAAKGSVAVADVSLLLGYTEQSAFARAFKRWTGTSPLQWRRAQCAGEQT